MPAREQLEPIWERVRDELRREVPDFKFHVWLSPLELVGVRGKTLFVRAPDHIRTCVRDRYLPLVREAARRGFEAGALVEIVDDSWEPGAGGEGRAALAPVGLNPKYTFEHFVIGEGNRLAHATALKVAELPGQAFNPLFIHGRPGLGKTHLLHAIGNYVLRYGCGLTVRYSTGEEFTSEFVRALRPRGDIGLFKERFRGVDVLLLDDVQFVADKARTEEELFHTFNVLRESGRQLVMTSDRRPGELAGVEQRLAERFASGMVAALDAPDLSVRRAILHKRALVDSLDASSALLEAIAQIVEGSVRTLEAALIQVVAIASMRGERATPELARQLLGGTPTSRERLACTITEIVDASAVCFGVSAAEILARDRRPTVTRARKLAMYLARELTDHSLPEIGRAFGGRDHSTVLSAIRRAQRDIDGDPQLAAAVESLRTALAADE